MATKFRPVDDQPLEPRPRGGGCFWRTIKVTWIVFSSLVTIAVAAVAAYYALGFQRGIGTLEQFNRDTAQLNEAYAFTPPAPGQMPPDPHWDAMFKVREAMRQGLSPEARERLTGLLALPGMDKVQLSLRFLGFLPDLQRLAEVRTEALRESGLSPREYQWLLGLAVRDALAAPERVPAGAGYHEVLNKLEAMTKANQDPADDLDAEFFISTLAEDYEAGQAAPPEVLERMTSNQPADYQLDLLQVTLRFLPQPDEIPTTLPSE